MQKITKEDFETTRALSTITRYFENENVETFYSRVEGGVIRKFYHDLISNSYFTMPFESKKPARPTTICDTASDKAYFAKLKKWNNWTCPVESALPKYCI